MTSVPSEAPTAGTPRASPEALSLLQTIARIWSAASGRCGRLSANRPRKREQHFAGVCDDWVLAPGAACTARPEATMRFGNDRLGLKRFDPAWPDPEELLSICSGPG